MGGALKRRVGRVLFLPGALSSRRAWEGVAEELQLRPVEGKEGLVIEVAGPVAGVQTIEEAAAQVKASHDLRHTVVVGHSYGGYIALELAKKNSEVVGLGLVNSQAKHDSENTIAARRKIIEIAGKAGVARVVALQKALLLYSANYHLLPMLEEMAEGVGAQAFVEQNLVSISREDSTDFLRTTQLPLWFCAGAEDSLLPVLVSENMHQAATGSVYKQLDVVGETGHMTHIESPEKVAHNLRNFLQCI